MTKRTVHPATIPGTRVYRRLNSDTISGLINREVFRWQKADETFWWHHVVLEHYEGGVEGARADERTDEQKALGLGISASWYSKSLKRAHLRIQELLEKWDKKRGY